MAKVIRTLGNSTGTIGQGLIHLDRSPPAADSVATVHLAKADDHQRRPLPLT